MYVISSLGGSIAGRAPVEDTLFCALARITGSAYARRVQHVRILVSLSLEAQGATKSTL